MSDVPELTPLETAALLREQADARIAGRIQALAEGAIRCRAGCFACCHQLVVVSPLEAHALAEFVSQDPELAARVEAGITRWRTQIAAREDLAGAMERFTRRDGYLSSEEGNELELLYWKAQLPCPFLSEGRCQVYPVRPFACREHHVLSEPELCSLDPDRVVLAGTRMEFRAVAGEVGEACFGMRNRLIPLPLALPEAASTADETPATASQSQVTAAAEQAQRRVRMALARVLAAERR